MRFGFSRFSPAATLSAAVPLFAATTCSGTMQAQHNVPIASPFFTASSTLHQVRGFATAGSFLKPTAACGFWYTGSFPSSPAVQQQRRFASTTSGSKTTLLAGKTLVFTGTLSMARREAVAMAERSGATVVKKVSSAVTNVVCGSGAGSKLTKAQAKGVAVWTEAEFLKKMTVEDHQVRLGENNGRIIQNVAGTGYQFSLAWDPVVDLDIKLQTPKGLVYYQNRKVAGADLDVDRIPDLGRPWAIRPVENIVCDKADPGHYKAIIVYYSNFNNVKGDIPYTLHCRVGKDHGAILHNTISKVGSGIGEFKSGDVVCTFDVKPNGQVGDVKFGGSGRPVGTWTPSGVLSKSTSTSRSASSSPARSSGSAASSAASSSSSGATSIQGKSVCFTGTLSMSRATASTKAKAAGAIVTKGVTRKTHFLVCGSGAGSKQTSANSWGVKVLTEAEFLRLV